MERDRLAAVTRSRLIVDADTGLERFGRMAAAIIDAPIVLLSIVDSERQHFVVHHGLDETFDADPSTPIEQSYCRIVADTERPLVVTDSSVDDRVIGHPANAVLGVAAYAGVPVRDEDGFVLGSFCAIDHQPREWSEDELGLLSDLAASVESELSLRSTRDALRQQIETERRERAFERALLAVATATNRAAGIEATASALVREGALVVDASFVSLGLLTDGTVTFYHGPNLDDSVAEEWPSAPIGTPVPMVSAIETNEPVLVSNREGFERWPAMAEEVETLGISSFLALPVTDEMTGLVGAIGMGWIAEHPSGAVSSRCDRLATLTTQALVRAHRFDQARAHARVLEQVILPSALPSIRGIELSGAYLAPLTDQRVGGDVYDAVSRPDGTVGIVIADATGHDLRAVRAAARVRHAIGVLLTEGRMPGEVLASVNEYVRRSTQIRHITCACAVIDQDAGTATIAVAGHPQPRILADGEVRRVGPLGQPLLGVAPYSYDDDVVAFAPGARLLAFTDGLVERRRRSIVDGEVWLDTTLPTIRSASVEDFVAELMAQVESGERADDIALIAVENVSDSPAIDGRSLVIEQRADAIDLGSVRRDVLAWLDGVGSAHLAEPVSLIATELLSNARDASEPDGVVALAASVNAGEVTLSVTNDGEDFTVPSAMPSPDSVRGRGLALVRALASDLRVVSESGRVTVEAVVTER